MLKSAGSLGTLWGKGAMIKDDTLFMDIDTQYDFLRPEGRLYIDGAEELIDRISEVRLFALKRGYSLLATVDWHSLEDEEISQGPDYKVTFPPHCLAGESGADRIGYLGELQIEHVGPAPARGEQLMKLVQRRQFHIVLRTSSVDAFANENTPRLLEAIAPKRVIVFGVALDICVNNAVQGLAKWGKAEIIVLSDIVKGLGVQPDEDVYERFEKAGVRMIAWRQLQETL
jgi:nicotinamidase/pyrazinamidase